MPNIDPIGEALGKEGTSSLIPSIPPIFNNGLDSRDSRPLPYPQTLDSGNFPISDAEDSSLYDSIIEPPGSIVNELNADAEADTLILNKTDSSSLILEVLSVPLNDSQPANSELDTLIGSLQEEPGIPSEQKTDPLLNPSSTAEDNSTILDSPTTTAISTQNSEAIETQTATPIEGTFRNTDDSPPSDLTPVDTAEIDTGKTIAIATDNANTNNNQETTQPLSVNSTQTENSNNPVSSTIESEVESEPPSNSHLNPVQTGADDFTSATIPENAALVNTAPLVAGEVEPTIVTDSNKIEEIKPTIVTDSSKTEELESTIATDSSTTDEIKPTIITDSSTTDEIKPTIVTDSSKTEELELIIATDSSRTDEIKPTVFTDSNTAEQVKETVEPPLPIQAENQTAIATSNTTEEVKETVLTAIPTSDKVEAAVEHPLPTSDQVEAAVNTASNTEQTGDNTTKQEPISSELNNDSNLNLIEPTLSTQQPDNTTATEPNPILLQLPTQTEPQTPNPENQTANIPDTLTENNNTSSNSSPTIAQQTNTNPTFTSGIFTVDSTGIVSIDYLFDGGFYQGELAVFSLRNMEEFIPGTPEFIAEAARRALTNSELGNIPIKDSTQAARFSGTMPDDGNWDAGEYQNPITFTMTPGDTFGIMLIPNGTVQQVFDNPNIDGTNRPLFSLSTANPASGFQLGQIADVTGNGNTFAYEDLRADGWTDKDYNDMIFTVTGATGIAPLLSSVIDPSKEWRNSPVGQELLEYVNTLTSDNTPPAISAELIQDTGSSSSDLLTNNPTISGTVTDSSSITSFSASLNNNSTNIELNNLLAPDGSFTLTRDILTTINNGSELPDGSHILGLQAVDIHGNTRSFEFAFTLDTTTSLTLFLDPAFDSAPIGDSDTENSTVTLIGQTEPNSTIVLLGTGTVATVATANATGQFQFPGVILTPGSNSFTATATDKAGNTSTTTLTVNSTPVPQGEIQWLAEGESFTQILERTFEIPSSPSILRVNIATIYFDTSDPDSINDAFEIALLDENGKSLVHTIAPGRDSFFNLTEGQPAELAAGVTYSGSTITLDLSQIDLSKIAPDNKATVQLRLVNNDSDTATKVGIASVSIQPSSTTTPPIATPAIENSASTPVNFSNLEDVSASLEAEYKQTSFNDKTNILYTDISVRNGGQYPVRGSLLVGIDNISDPTVRVLGTDGMTPEGIPYYNFTDLVSGGILKSGELTGTGTLKFYNPNEPNGVQFTYDLVFLSELNSSPEFVGEPNKEAVVGKSYAYQAIAIDPNGDAVTYSLLAAPQGMAIDSASGKITWNPVNGDIGNHSVTVQVEDGKGGVDKLEYTLNAISPPPNRPPIFTSTPVVDAWLKQLYTYDSNATDPDSDTVSYSLIIGPEGMKVNPSTGIVEWTPPAVLMLGDTVLGKINLPGESDEFTFSGTQGQRIYIDPLQYNSNWNFDIISPSGQKISSASPYLDSNKIFNLTETGNYRIVTSANADATGSYGWSIIDLGLVPAAPFDKTVKGTLSLGTEDDIYRFTGSKGQKLFFDNKDKNNTGNLDWVIYDADNKIVASQGSFGDMEPYLPADGEYMLALRGKSSFTSSVDYSFEIITPDEVTKSIELGTNATPKSIYSEIAEKGEKDFYTFTGIAGQRIYFDQLFHSATNSSNLAATITSPSGQQLLSNTYLANSNEPITLKENGIYRVEIDASGENTGSYGFNILDIEKATFIDKDTNISNTLNPGKETHLYKIDGSKNQRLYLDSLSTITGANWILYDSGLNSISPNYSTNTDMEVVLPNTGSYTLAIRGENGNIPVDYSFQIITPEEHSKPLTLNEPVIDSISEKGERDVYTFTGVKGQRVFLDTLMETPNVLATLASPSGTKVINSRGLSFSEDYWRGPIVLPEDGIYSLTVDGSEETIGGYSFSLLDVSRQVLPKETVAEGSLDPGQSTQFYFFEGSGGERIYFESQENSPNSNWRLYDSNGTRLYSLYDTGLSNDFEYVLPGDGTYYLRLLGGNNLPTGYKIQFVPTTSPPTPLPLNDLISDSISKLGEQNVYTFNGAVGQTLYFDPQIGSNQIAVKLQTPSGKELFSNENMSKDSAPITLKEPGEYKLIVDGNNDTIGNYSFVLKDQMAQLPPSGGASGILDAGATDLYQFTGKAGQKWKFDSTPGTEPVLYAPTNSQLAWPYNSQVASGALLPTDGTYILALRNTSTNTVNYNVSATKIAEPSGTNSGLGVLYQGTLSVPLEVDGYPFTATAGSLVYFDGQSNDGSKLVRLYNPDGTISVINGISSQSDYGVYQLQQTGNYKLEIYGNNNTTGNYKFQLVDLKASPSLSLNPPTPTSVSLTAWETKAFKFTGEVGQKVWLDGLNTSNPNVTAKLLNSSGVQVASTGDLSGDIELQTLEASGEYYLVLQSNNPSATTVNFRLLDDNGAQLLTFLDNQNISGSFGTASRETALYKFDGNKGERLYFNATQGNYYNYYYLYDPDGTRILFPYTGYDDEKVLPSDGQYTLVFKGNAGTDNKYGVQIITPEDKAFSIGIGDNPVVGEIAKPGQQNTYTFTGQEGQRLWFDSLAAATNISGTLYSPTGVKLWSQDVGSDLVEPTLTTLPETGTYRFVVDGSTDTTGAYSFRLLDFAAAQNTNLDTKIAGNFGTSKQETRLYKFTGTEGQSVYFDRTEGNSYNSYYLYAPDGRQILSQAIFSDNELLKLPSSGEYTLVFSGRNQPDNNYALEMVTPELAPPLDTTIGDSIKGEIREAGEYDTYTFTGTPGQKLWLDSLFPSTTITAYLSSPTKNNIWSQNVGSESPYNLLTLNESGTYTLKVDASGDSTGAYEFRFLDFNQAETAPLDEPIEGNFGTSKREANAYKFTGIKGQPLYFDRTDGTDYNDYYNSYYLYDSYGKLVFPQSLYYDNDLTELSKLPYSGEYTLIFAGNNSVKNNYSLEIVTPDIITTPYQVGDTASGKISEAGEHDIYSFNAVLGQELWFDSLENSSPYLTVKIFDPNGQQVLYKSANNDTNNQPLTITKEGTYKIVVDVAGDRVGDTYNFRLLDLKSSAQELTLDTPITGNFGDGKRTDKTYKFKGTQGDYLYFDIIQGDPYNNYYLIDPYGQKTSLINLYGQQTLNPGLNYDSELSLPFTGEYQLVLSGQGRDNSNYELKVVTPVMATAPLTLGNTVTSDIKEAGEKDTYTFDGQVGQKLFFDAKIGNGNLRAKLYDPFGNLIIDRDTNPNSPTNSDWSLALSATGSYRLVIDGYDSNTGDYSFTLSDWNQVTPLNLAAPNIGTAEKGEVDLYQIIGSQGQVLKFDLNAATWSGGANWVLYGPDNKVVIPAPPSSSPDFKVTLPTAGLYTLAITGNNTSPVSYNFSIKDETQTPITNPTGLNSTISGLLTPQTGSQKYTFTANAGTQVFFDSFNDINNRNSGILAKLIAPDGTVVFNPQDSGSNTPPKVLPQTGEYTLEISRYSPSSTTGNYQFRIAELPNSLRNPATNYLEIGNPVSGTLNGTEAKVYTFDGVEGLRVAFNGMVGNNVSATLYNPSGAKVLSSNGAEFSSSNFQSNDIAPATLTQNGLYQLVIEGTQPSSTNYSFQLLELSTAADLPFNLPVTGKLENGQQSKAYKFLGNEGEHLFFDAVNKGATSNNWKLYGPDNKLVINTYNTNIANLRTDFELNLPATGEYTLLIEGGTNSAPVNYEFRAFSYEKVVPDVVIPGTGENHSSGGNSQGLYAVKLLAEDGRGGEDIQEYSIRVWPDPENTAPTIVSTPSLRFGLDDKIYRYQLQTVDTDGNKLRYRLVDAPLGALIDGDTGELLWFPEKVAPNDKTNFTVEVADGRGGIDTQTFTVDAYGALGLIQGAVFEDLNGNGFRDSKLIKGDKPAIILAIDVSGSTAAPFVGPNGVDNVLEAQIAATEALLDTIIAQGLGDKINIGIIPHQASAIIADLDPATDGVQYYTTPLADKDHNGIPDIRQILATYRPDGHNNFTTAVQAIRDLVEIMAGDSNSNVTPNVIFMSDGYGNLDATVAASVTAELKSKGIGLTAFGIGQYSTISTLQKIDPNAVQLTDVQELVDIFGGFDPRYATEPLMENVTVYLDTNDNGVLDNGEPWQLSKKDNSESILGKTNYYYSFDNLLPGTYKVRMVVPDAYSQTAPSSSVYIDTVTTTKGETYTHLFGLHKGEEKPNSDPVFLTTQPKVNLKAGESLVYKALASDADIDAVTYSLVLNPEGMSVDSENGTVVWTPTTAQVEKYYTELQAVRERLIAFGRGEYAPKVVKFDVALLARDGKGGQALQYIQVELEPDNNPPVFTSTLPENLTPQTGKIFQYQAIANDADGDIITYSLKAGSPTGVTIDASTGLVTWKPTTSQLGQYYITAIATDSKGAEATLEVPLQVIAPIQNQLPEITSNPRTTARTGTAYFSQLAVTNTDGDSLTFSLVKAPSGMTINSEGLIAWTPNAAQLGDNVVEVKVIDSQGGIDTKSWQVNVSNFASNQPPVITSVPDGVTNLERVYHYQLAANDPDGDYLLWSLDSAPKGMVIDAQTGSLSWQPTSDNIGEQVVQVRVTDSLGAYTGQEFELKVTGVNTPPAILSNPVTQAGKNQNYSYQVVGVDPENDKLRYSLGSHPEGMKVDANTGLIEWMSPNVGNYAVEVLVTDTQGGVGNQTFNLLVGTQAINHAPTITSTPVFTAALGSVYSYDVEAVDPDGGTVSYQLLKKPDGMRIDSVTGVISWDSPITGYHSVVVGVSDAGGLGSAQGFTLIARENSAPVIPTIGAQSATLGSTYRYDLKATDAQGDLLTFALVKSPNGMTIDEYGRISWTPSASDVGTNKPVEITVTDSFGSISTVAYNLSVVADSVAPKVNVSVSSTQVNKGDSVTFTVNAVDNVKVESLGLTVDNIPVILDAKGQATVKFNSSGNVEVVATAKDAAGHIETTSQTVKVIDPSDVNFPIVSIDLDDDVEISAPYQIIGTISDSNLDYYIVEVAPVGGGEFKEIYRNDNPVNINNDVIATFDPTVLANDAYILRVKAVDDNNHASITERVVNVAGDLKLGNFRLSFTDLSIPVSGIPITVTRSYDSLNANSTDDFGYGWRLEFRDTDLRTSLKSDPQYEELGINSVPFKDGTKVFITLPGGKRETFTFNPTPDRLNAYLAAAGPGGSMYHPAFKSQDGSTSTLSVKDTRLTRNGNEYYGLNGEPFNPVNPAFGGVYVLTTKEGIIYEIDANSGDLLTATDPNGNKLTFSDAGIKSSSGKEVTFGRDASGRIVNVVDPAGEKIEYEYDAKGDLVAVTDREDNKTQFKYGDEDRKHFLTEVIDPLGRTGVRTEYDDSGRLKQMIDASGEAVELVYDPDNSVQKVKDVFGKETTYVYDLRGNVLTEIDPLGKRIDRTYDGDNNVLTETVITREVNSQGNSVEVKSTTEWTYDGSGNKLTEKDALGNVSRWSYNGRGQVLTETDALGNSTSYTYSPSGNLRSTKDAAGNVNKFDYDLRGNLLTLTDAADNISRFEYDASGNVISVKDALGNVTNYTYNGSGDRLSETRFISTPNGVQEIVTKWTYDSNGKVKSTTDALNRTTKYEYDANGNQLAVIDALNHRTEYRYDEKGQLVEMIYPDDTPNNSDDNPRDRSQYDAAGRLVASYDKLGEVTKYKYDDVGRLIETIYPDITPNTDADNPRSLTEYYKNGDVKAEIDELGNRTEYRYNINGQLVEVIYADETPSDLTDNPRSKTEYDKLGRTLASIDSLGRVTRYEYDSLGRLVKTIYPDLTQGNLDDNPIAKTEYDKLGRRISATDSAGKTVKYEYDALGRLTDVVQFLSTQEVRTEYGYDELGRLIWQEDAEDNRTEFEYDKNGRRVAVELPLNQRSSTTYDAVGNVETVTDFNGDTITYKYDVENRLISKEFANIGEVPVKFTYTIDGQIKAIVDARGTTSFNYDELGRLVSRIDPDGVHLASGATIEYEYDVAGNRTEVRTPNGSVSYTYDEQNRLKTVTDSDNQVTSYFYDEAGNLSRTELPNGVVESRSYDELNRLKLLAYEKNGVTLQSFDYSLDLVGQRKVVTEVNNRKVGYEYDDLYRLTKETIFAPDGTVERTISYGYDLVGNRLTKTDSVEGVTIYTYDDNDRLKKEELRQNSFVVGTVEYGYDDNGNTKTRTKKDAAGNVVERVTYEWNQDHRLIGVQTSGGDAISYEYDADGVRVSKTVNGVTTEYLVDKNRDYAQVLESSVNNGLIASYVYGLDLISQERGNDDSFYLVDGLGSTMGLTDAQGNVTDTYSYDAFGNLIGISGGTDNDYLFAGEQFDEGLGQYYLRQRYYNSSIGRFTRRDTYTGHISDPLTLHKYIYTNDNPVNGIDPSGLSTMSQLLNDLNALSQLAARAYTFVSNPVVMDVAKAWAVIISVGAISAISALVLEETNKKGETQLRVMPDQESDPKNKQKSKSKSEDDNETYQMRLQLQDAPGNTFGIPIENIPEVGVTVAQVGQAVMALWTYRRSLAKWFPEEHDTALIKAMAGVTKKAKESPPRGVFQGSSQVYSRQWNQNDPKGNHSVSRGYYRVDFENLRGHNLRNF